MSLVAREFLAGARKKAPRTLITLAGPEASSIPRTFADVDFT
jgi:hypothetical protein